MGDARASQNTERLPWIANENDLGGQSYWRGTREFGPGIMAALSAAALLLVLALAYWIAMHNWQNPIPQKTEVVPKATTAVIPVPRKPASSHARSTHRPRAVVRASPVPAVRPTVQRPVPLQLPQNNVAARSKSSASRTEVAKARPVPQPKSAAQSAKVAVAKVQPTTDVTPRVVANANARGRTPARQTAPALPPSAYAMRGPPSFMTCPYFDSPQLQGRVVQVGAFRDVHQAKLWWGQMVRAYPQVGQLQPSVIESRYPNGVPYYRFQIGTNSPASSLMLCRMMQQINLSCSVTGLPGRGMTW